MAESSPAEHLRDFPLQPELGFGPRLPAEPASGVTRGPAAPLGARLSAAAADAATVLLLTALGVLAARIATGASPRPEGVPWLLGFVVYLSLCASVPPLVLFGRTVGMAISDLSARGAAEAGISAGEALRRWVGTLSVAATAGIVLLWTRRRPDFPTPADRLSGRSLSLD
jgi:RDD family